MKKAVFFYQDAMCLHFYITLIDSIIMYAIENKTLRKKKPIIDVE